MNQSINQSNICDSHVLVILVIKVNAISQIQKVERTRCHDDASGLYVLSTVCQAYSKCMNAILTKNCKVEMTIFTLYERNLKYQV